MSDTTGTPVVCTCGLDLSLTGTGFALKQGQGITLATIKTVPKDFPNDLSRLLHIRDMVMGKIPDGIQMIAVEDFFTPHGPAVGAAIKLAMLGTAIRLALYEKGISFIVVAPNSLKKFITGKGSGEKSMILREVFRRYGSEAKNDNEADALVLAHIAESIFLTRSGVTQEDQTKPQKEVVKGLLDAAAERGYNLR